MHSLLCKSFLYWKLRTTLFKKPHSTFLLRCFIYSKPSFLLSSHKIIVQSPRSGSFANLFLYFSPKSCSFFTKKSHRGSEVSIGTDLQFVLYPLTLLSPWLLCLMLFLIIFSFWVRNQKSVPENDVLEKWGLWYYLACFILSLTRHCVKLTP